MHRDIVGVKSIMADRHFVYFSWWAVFIYSTIHSRVIYVFACNCL